MAALDDTCARCACSVCSAIRFNVQQIFRLFALYGWMLDSYVVDFFQEDLWQKLPSAWKTFFDEVTPNELGEWILKEKKCTRVWPLSLLALRNFIESAEIPRNHESLSNLKCCNKSIKDSHSEDSRGRLEERDEEEKSAKDVQFNNLFNKHVKKKKRYEIDIISRIAAECARDASSNCIVDIGSGMGHLARVLAYKNDLCVTCIEQNSELLDGARKWDEQLHVSLSKHIADFKAKKPHHVSLQVGISSLAREQLANELRKIFEEEFEALGSDSKGFGLLGLHPCGDLAATLLRFYSTEEKARFICIVGCCYMKLTLSSEGEDKGYPMSEYVRTIKNHELSYAALEVACHAVEKHCDKLKDNNYSDLIVHGYRAALECLLIEKNPQLRRSQLKNTKIKEDTTFKEYCTSATEVLDPKDRPVDDDFERADVKMYLNQWKRVLTFGTLRLLIAPLVETLVLYDRFLYLSELNLSPSLKAEFDSRVSPRNILLVSIKK